MVSVALAGCASMAPPPPTELPEVRPGYVAGYLRTNDLPDGLALLPPPPGAGSTALALDDEVYRTTRAMRGSPRWHLAAKDAELRFPKAAEVFSCTLGMAISAEATPHLNMMLRRIRMDASRAADTAKDHYKRKRPFAAAGEPSCTPQEDARMRPDSYPSGHASIGWAWALALAEAVPERSNAILARGLAFGDSRFICGAHYRSDVEWGRVLGASTLSRLHVHPDFTAQLALARKEIEAARAGGARSPLDCDAEAKALATR